MLTSVGCYVRPCNLKLSFSGANPSAEGQEESLEDGSKTVINLVHSSDLVSTTFSKKDYLTEIKVRNISLQISQGV